MLRELVSQARSGTSPELEAITAERDFFREKYAEQIDAMEELKGQLKESQRVINKLRNQILDLEVEKSRLLETGDEGVGKAPKQIGGSSGSTNTSVTGLTYEDESLRSAVDDSADCAKVEESANDEVADGSAGEGNVTCLSGKEANASKSDAVRVGTDLDSPPSQDTEQSTPDEDSEDEEDDESDSEDDEAEKIRANAERMLLWANYQTSKHSTPNTSLIQESTDGLQDETKSQTSGIRSPAATPSSKGGAIVYSLPTSLDKRQSLLDDDDDSSLGVGSSSRHHAERSVESSRSGTASSNRNGGKIGNLFNNLRDMIDPPSESDDSEGESDDESTDSNSH